MELEVKGTIETIGETVEGVNKAGDNWQKLTYTLTTEEKYNNLYAFEVFGKDASTMFRKYNKEGDKVTVKFNVNTNEWKGKVFHDFTVLEMLKKRCSDYRERNCTD